MRHVALCLLIVIAAGSIVAGVWRLAADPSSASLTISERDEPAAIAPDLAEQLAGGAILFESPVYQHGAFKTEFSHTFMIRNRGTVAMRVTDVQPSCTCSGYALDTRLIAPGGTAQLAMTIKPRFDRIGQWAYSLDLRYQLGEATHEQRLAVVATYQPDTVIPDHIPLYCVSGQATTARLSLTDYRDDPMRVLSVKTSSPHLAARLLPAVAQTEPGHRIDIEVSYDGQGPIGMAKESVILATSDPTRPSVVVIVNVDKVSHLRVLPERLTLRPAKQGGYVGRLLVDDRRGRPLGTLKIVSSHPSVETTVNKLTESKCAIEVRHKGAMQDEPLSLTVSSPECSSDEIKVQVLIWRE